MNAYYNLFVIDYSIIIFDLSNSISQLNVQDESDLPK